jgi:hypothetical protein
LLIALTGMALLAGCGGGGSGGEDPSSSSSPGSTSAETQVAKEVQAKMKEVKDHAIEERRQVERHRQSQSARPPQIEHHDSGGGSASFRHKGGDNSIPEYGEEASDQEREEAADALHGYLDSLAAQRWEAACSYLSASQLAMLDQLPEISKQQSDLEGCPEVLAALNGGASQGALEVAAKVDVASLRVEEDRAFMLYRGADGENYVMPMIREEGAWRVGSLAGTAGL